MRPLAEAPNRAVMHRETTQAVFLAGFMGAGKTTVGCLLAERLGWEFLDLDQYITSRTGKSPASIFASSGEDGFRRRESEALYQVVQELSPLSPKIIALGGGTLTVDSNLEAVQSTNAHLVFLDAPASELYLRCVQQDVARPVLGTPEEFNERFRRRYRSYHVATLTVNTSGKSCIGVMEEIVQHLAEPSPEAT